MNTQTHLSSGAGLAPEERARANMYALIGRLFYAAPDAILLAEICAYAAGPAESADGGALGPSWRALLSACQRADPALVKFEYETLFVGVGKAQVTPYTSHYVTGGAPDRQLVMLRDQLAQWGLARNTGVFEVEDHLSGLCDVMRFLIEQQAPLGDQRLFFERFVYAPAGGLFAATMGASSAIFYREVVPFSREFFEVEKAAFEMNDTSATIVK